jgi:hypothetical protein
MITFYSCILLIWFDQRFSCCYIRCSHSNFSENLRDIFEDCRDLFNSRVNSSNLVMIFRSIRSIDWDAFRWNLQNLLVWKFTSRNQRCLIVCTEWDDKEHTYWVFSCLFCQDLIHCRIASQNQINLSLEEMCWMMRCSDEWKIERVLDHVTQHHLIFICMRRLDFLQICNDPALINRFETGPYRQFVDPEMKSFFSSVTS